MTLNIGNDNITSNHTAHTARLLPGDQARWEVDWLPGQAMDRRHAIAAMAVADVTRNDEQVSQRLSPGLIATAANLLPDLDDPSSTPSPPEKADPDQGGKRPDPEAGG